MSKIKVDRISNRAGTGAPEFVNGIKVVGLTSVADVVGGAATFTELTTTGTLTYEDVTEIDSVGLITAPTGIVVNTNGINVQAGICTFPANSTIGGNVPTSTGKAIAMAMVFG